MLTLDVEDWEHANFSSLSGQEAAIAATVRERRYAMDANTDRWIEVLERHSALSTCFVLGEFAARYPEAVKRLQVAGHEIASHSYTHDLVYGMSREAFREQVRRSVGLLGELTGRAPRGFRAPSWSVDERTPWYCDELIAQGFKYDSSQFPVRTPLFGEAGAPLQVRRQGALTRVPVTVLTIGAARLPFASGAFFRIWPGCVIRWGLARASQRGQPPMIVLHPRELDPAHPRLPLRGWEGVVHYWRLHSTLPKLESVLRRFQGVGVEEWLQSTSISAA